MGWRMGQLLRGLRSGAAEAPYHVTFVNGILYISKAPAIFDGNVLSLMAVDAGGE